MTQHPFGHHLSTCSNPTNCAEYAAIEKMTPDQYFRYLTERDHVDRTALRAACDFRTVSTSATAEQQRTYGVELKRRDPGFLDGSIQDVTDSGGTYQTRVNGKTVTRTFALDANGAIVTPAFPTPVSALGGYERGLAVLRAANAAERRAKDPLAGFDDRYRAARRAELGLDDDAANKVPRLTVDSEDGLTLVAAAAEELSKYAPPRPYDEAFKAMREKEKK